MKQNLTKTRVISSIIWKFIERSSTQFIQFVVQIILARLLLPDDFGVIGIIMVFINLSSIFINGGFSTALIQKKHITNNDYSIAFYISLTISVILYILLFSFAPLISRYLEMPVLKSMLRVLAVTLIFGAFISIQQAVIAREMLFKKLFYSGISSASISGLIGISLAYFGFGVWALVYQQLISQIMLFLILCISIKWRPNKVISLSGARDLFRFGWKILMINLLNEINDNIRSLLIGKRYSPTILGYYNRGNIMPQIIINNITVTIQSIMLPTLSSYQDDLVTIKSLLRRSIKMSAYIIFPMMIGLAIIAEPLVIVLLTEKWLQSVPFIQLACFTYLIYPINTANIQATTSLGRSDILLKNDLIKKPVGLLVLLGAIIIFDSPLAVAVSMLLSTFISTIISMYPNKKILGYSYREQLTDILPSLFLSIFMAGGISLINYLGLSALNTLLLQILLGCILYIVLSFVLKIEDLNYIIKIFKELKQKNIGTIHRQDLRDV